jgi:hypothetical protein
MAGKRIPDELITKYTEIAKKICENEWSKSYEEVKAALEQNRENFFEELSKI